MPLNVFIIVSSMVRWSLQYMWYFSFSGILWTSTFLLINVGVVNQYLSQKISTIHKTIIHLKEIFHHQICIHFSTRYEKNPDVPKDGSPSLSKPIWDLIPPSCLSALWFSTTPLYIQWSATTSGYLNLTNSSFTILISFFWPSGTSQPEKVDTITIL